MSNGNDRQTDAYNATRAMCECGKDVSGGVARHRQATGCKGRVIFTNNQRQYERVAVGWCAAPGVVSAVVVARGDIVDSEHDVLRVYHGGHVHDVFWSPGRALYLFKPAASEGRHGR